MSTTSYVICGTPRSGSTLLCRMLAATGLAGHPNSYFRHQNIAEWAVDWGVDTTGGTDDAAFDRGYVDAMRRVGAAGTGVFGLRLMWNGVAEARKRLGRFVGTDAELPALIAQAFGRPAFLHLSRRDKAAQAVSLLKAEQSGIWHRGADGSVLEGAEVPGALAYDEPRLRALLAELEADDAAWADFFAAHGIEPLRLTYEQLAADPRDTLRCVLATLGLDPGTSATIPIPTARLADATSTAWATRLAQATGR